MTITTGLILNLGAYPLKNFLALKMSKGGAGVRAYNESLGLCPKRGSGAKPMAQVLSVWVGFG